MIKQLLFISPLVILGVAMDISSNSAPASSTGAPGEVDCTTSGCHSTFKVNSGPGATTMSFEDGMTEYTPGKTYTINVDVNQASLIRFGFQLVAIKDKDNSNAGQLSPIDASRNQITKGYGKFAERKYMTYTYKSTEALTVGNGHWSFNWTAPATNEGPVTFYLSGLAANNDGMDIGDYCYTTSLKLGSPQVQDLNTAFSFSAFPNPVKDNITATYFLPENSDVKIEMIDLQGKITEELLSEQQQAGPYRVSLSLTKKYAPGVYFMSFKSNGNTSIQKMFITE